MLLIPYDHQYSDIMLALPPCIHTRHINVRTTAIPGQFREYIQRIRPVSIFGVGTVNRYLLAPIIARLEIHQNNANCMKVFWKPFQVLGLCVCPLWLDSQINRNLCWNSWETITMWQTPVNLQTQAWLCLSLPPRDNKWTRNCWMKRASLHRLCIPPHPCEQIVGNT